MKPTNAFMLALCVSTSLMLAGLGSSNAAAADSAIQAQVDRTALPHRDSDPLHRWQSVGTANVGQTQFALFSADETAGVGVDLETPVSEDYTRASSRFIGKIDKVTISTKK